MRLSLCQRQSGGRGGQGRHPEEYHDDEGDDPASESPAKSAEYRSRDLVLDENGALRARIDDLPKITAPHAIHAELEFRDPNGEMQTVSGRVPLVVTAIGGSKAPIPGPPPLRSSNSVPLSSI